MWAYRRSPHLQRREPVKRPEHGWAWHCGQAARCSQGKLPSHKACSMGYPRMRRDSPPQARSVAPEPAPRFHAKSWPRLPRPSCTQNEASRFSQSNPWGAWEMRDVLLAIHPATRAGSGPALPVVCNMLDRHDGREDDGRAARTRGRLGLCHRDHPCAARSSPAHIWVELRAQSGFATSSITASVSWPMLITCKR
jgi:hypothetical protein